MFWKVLRIEPTSDRNVIRRAYRELLTVTNPEDSPEEFKALREAYEQALAYADEHANGLAKTPAEQWQEDLAALYDDFARRNTLSEWQKLLNRDICLSVDTRMECEDALLRFLMEHYFISHEIWVYFDQQFSWLDRQEELYQTYPADFIDYVIANGIHFEDILPMDLFIPGQDGEEAHRYLQLYLKAKNAGNEDEQEDALKEMTEAAEQHPYGTAEVLRQRVLNGEEDSLKDLYDLYRSYPDHLFPGQLLADTLFDLKRIPECRQVLEEMKKTDAKNFRLRWLEACCLAEQDAHQEAVKIIDSMLADSDGNREMQYELEQKRREWNCSIIEKLEKEIGEHPDDTGMKVNLAWAYLENDRTEEAEALASSLPEDYEDRFGYYNLNSSIAMTLGSYEKAEGLLEKLAEVTENLPADTEQNISRRGRLGEVLIRLGFCCRSLQKNEKAEEVYERALHCAKNRAEVLTYLADISLADRKYEKTLEYCRQLIREYPGGYRGYLLMAYAWFHTNHDREAYNAVEKALDLCRSDLEVYTLKARILIHNNMAENAKEIIDFLKESDAAEAPSVLFAEGVYKEDCENDSAAASELYEKCAAALENHYIYAEYGAELFYRLLYIKGAVLDAYVEEDRKQLMELADKGLECNPEHYGLKDYKAWLLVRAEAYEEARTIYLELQKNPYHEPSVEAELGYICYQDLEHSADQALAYYEQSLANGGKVSGHYYAGVCLMVMHRLEEAAEHFQELKKQNPDSVDGPFYLSIIYSMENRLEKALEEAEEAVERIRERQGDQSVYYIRKATVLRKMKRYDEAIEVIREAMERYNYAYGNRLIFQIYAHAGRLQEAESHLKQWAEKDSTDSELCDCGILLHLYRKDFAGAVQENERVSGCLDPDRALEVDHILAECFGDYPKQLECLLKWLQYRMDHGGFDVSRIEGSLAVCCFRLGDMEHARLYAERALKEIDQKLAAFETDKLLFMARKIRLLAILGRKEETEETIKACRSLPFCQNCPEQTCKDADIFRMEAEEIFGNYEKAYEIACACQSLYPDEEDFLIAACSLKRK